MVNQIAYCIHTFVASPLIIIGGSCQEMSHRRIKKAIRSYSNNRTSKYRRCQARESAEKSTIFYRVTEGGSIVFKLHSLATNGRLDWGAVSDQAILGGWQLYETEFVSIVNQVQWITNRIRQRMLSTRSIQYCLMMNV